MTRSIQTRSVLHRIAVPLLVASGLAFGAGCTKTVTQTTTTETPGQTIVTPNEPGAPAEPYAPGTTTTETGASSVTTTTTETYKTPY